MHDMFRSMKEQMTPSEGAKATLEEQLAQPLPGKARHWQRYAALAACAALIVAAVPVSQALRAANEPPRQHSYTTVDTPRASITEQKHPLDSTSTGEVQPADDAGMDEARWLSAAEITGIADTGPSGMVGGLNIPTYIAYGGAFYGAVGEATADDRFSPDSGTVLFNEDGYGQTAYLVKDRPDCIALLINGYFTIYQAQFEVRFELDGVTYRIAYPAVHPDSRVLGDVLLADDGFTVYEAIFYPGEAREQAVYVADILPTLRAEGYSFFAEDGVEYADAWWVVQPKLDAVPELPADKADPQEGGVNTGDLPGGAFVGDVPAQEDAVNAYQSLMARFDGQYPAWYGGAYIDSTGVLTVLLVDSENPGDKSLELQILEWADSDRVVFSSAKYSYAHLAGLMDELNALLDGGQFASSASTRWKTASTCS